MITPPETMFIIVGALMVSGLLITYACSLLIKRIEALEKRFEKLTQKRGRKE